MDNFLGHLQGMMTETEIGKDPDGETDPVVSQVEVVILETGVQSEIVQERHHQIGEFMSQTLLMNTVGKNSKTCFVMKVIECVY